jgi:hypothetical protein
MSMLSRLSRRLTAIVVGIVIGAGLVLSFSLAVGAGIVPRLDRPAAPHDFPRNENGESYGSASDAASPDDQPDLISAVGADGTEGFVKRTDLELPDPSSPAEAVARNSLATRKPIPLYAQDGKTVIGEFRFSKPPVIVLETDDPSAGPKAD